MIKPSRKLKNEDDNANRKSAIDAKLDHQNDKNSFTPKGSTQNQS
jgi:hypothetical protein